MFREDAFARSPEYSNCRFWLLSMSHMPADPLALIGPQVQAIFNEPVFRESPTIVRGQRLSYFPYTTHFCHFPSTGAYTKARLEHLVALLRPYSSLHTPRLSWLLESGVRHTLNLCASTYDCALL